MPSNHQTTITNYANAGYPAVAIATSDEDRTIANVLGRLPKRPAWRIAATGGLVDAANGRSVDPKGSYQTALGKVCTTGDSILVMLDFQHIIRNATAYRMLRDALGAVKGNGSMIVLIAPSWAIPPELEHDIPVMHDSLPSRQELTAALDVCVRGTGVDGIEDDLRNKLLDSASGLTLAEAEGAFALSFDDGGFDADIVSAEKMKLVRASGKLDVSAPANPDDLGGLGGLKAYIRDEVIPTINEPDLRVRAIMTVGVPGGGKSLTSRVLGAMLGWPVLSANIGKLKGSLQGESEANMHAMLKLAEAVAPCVLRLDEVEKGIGGHASSSQTDGGVTLGMVGILLTWLEEHTAQIITFGTCNDFSKLPAEFSRAGRFDVTMFVDLPTAEERVDIAMIHLKKYGCTDSGCGITIAQLSDGWTGAEIAQLVRSVARRTRKQFTSDALTAAAVDIKPISKVRADEIRALRDWGRSTLRIANTPETAATPATGRTVRKQGR